MPPIPARSLLDWGVCQGDRLLPWHTVACTRNFDLSGLAGPTAARTDGKGVYRRPTLTGVPKGASRSPRRASHVGLGYSGRQRQDSLRCRAPRPRPPLQDVPKTTDADPELGGDLGLRPGSESRHGLLPNGVIAGAIVLRSSSLKAKVAVFFEPVHLFANMGRTNAGELQTTKDALCIRA